jgi:hypothetical protein
VAFKLRHILLSFLIIQSSFAAPIDWKGTLSFDTSILKDVRRTGSNCTVANGSQCINPEEENARFQSMTLKLNPNLIINDGVTVKGELSTGGTRGVKLGESTQYEGTNGGSYFAQTTSSTLNVNQLYAELYADTALYRVGRFSKHFGLGAVVNNGNKTHDKFFSGYEGIEAQLKLGNFHLTPMWAKLHTSNNPNGKYDSYENSISAVYDNPNKNLKVGVYYALREVESSDTLNGTGSQNVNLIDIYFSKTWGDFSFGLEVPMLSGEVSGFYGTSDADFDANAYIIESSYQVNSKWKLGLNAGMVKGDDGSTDSFEGMYLHPNYKVSQIMFKYNYNGFMDSSYDIYNASIVNTTYAQLYAHYNVDEWTWRLSAMMAKANEVASDGNDFYDHEKNAVVTAAADQSDDLGTELNVAFDYQWNPNVVFSGHLGYHLVGDYYSFINDADDEMSVTNVMATGMSLAINF